MKALLHCHFIYVFVLESFILLLGKGESLVFLDLILNFDIVS